MNDKAPAGCFAEVHEFLELLLEIFACGQHEASESGSQQIAYLGSGFLPKSGAGET